MAVYVVVGSGVKKVNWFWRQGIGFADLIEADSEDEALGRAYDDVAVQGLESVRCKVAIELFAEDLIRLSLSARSSKTGNSAIEV